MKNSFMGFFTSDRKQREEEFRTNTEEKLKLLDGMEEKAAEIQKSQEELEQHIRQLDKKIQRHDMTLEDYLEALEDDQEKKRSHRQELHALEEENHRLVSLAALYQEQFWRIRKFCAGSDSALARQLDLMEQALSSARLAAGFCPVEGNGRYSRELHEITEVIETEEQEKDQTIAEIYEPGWTYQGSTGKKAKASVYRYRMTAVKGEGR